MSDDRHDAIAPAVAALAVGDLDAFADAVGALAGRGAELSDVVALAELIVFNGFDAGFGFDTTVDGVALALAGRAGMAATAHDIERLHGDGAARARGRSSPRSLLEDSRLDTDALRRLLQRALRELDARRAECDELERRVAELGGARVLADELAAELERDEWIRSRLRRAKATPPARALIYLRRRWSTRTSSATSS